MRKTLILALLLTGVVLAAQSMTTSTSHHTTFTLDTAAHQDRTERVYRATVRGILDRGGTQEIVFEQTVESDVDLTAPSRRAPTQY